MNKEQPLPSRRNFLRLLTSATVGASLLTSTRLLGETSCNPYGICVSQVDFAEFAQEAFQSQKKSEWCWAACISMLFAFYGHPVSQERIVTEVYGAPLNWPSGYGINIAKQLNRKWTDDNGKHFRSTLTGAYDHDAQVNNLSNSKLVDELDRDHPVIIGAGGHAMVLTALQYQQTPNEPILGVFGVFDPWPGRGARNLTQQESYIIERGGILRFVATARIVDL